MIVRGKYVTVDYDGVDEFNLLKVKALETMGWRVEMYRTRNGLHVYLTPPEGYRVSDDMPLRAYLGDDPNRWNMDLVNRNDKRHGTLFKAKQYPGESKWFYETPV